MLILLGFELIKKHANSSNDHMISWSDVEILNESDWLKRSRSDVCKKNTSQQLRDVILQEVTSYHGINIYSTQ